MSLAAHFASVQLRPALAPQPKQWQRGESALAPCQRSTRLRRPGHRIAPRPERGAAIALAAASGVAARKRKRIVAGNVSPPRPVPSHITKPPYVENGPKRVGVAVQHEYSTGAGKIEIKTPEQIEGMRASGALAREVLEEAGKMVAVGVTTDEIDELVHELTIERGAYPSPLQYCTFPKSVCTSINEVLAHGIPDDRPLQDGDILNIDVTVYLNGFHGDTSSMFYAGRPSKQTMKLMRAARRATDAGIAVCGPGVDWREVGKAIHAVHSEANYYVDKNLVGHGIGSFFHGTPEVCQTLNDFDVYAPMRPGMTFTIEPILVENNDSTMVTWKDQWTMATTTGARSAQFEHTILITEDGHEILTGPNIDWEAIGAKQAKLQSGGKAPEAKDTKTNSSRATSGSRRGFR